MSPPAEGRAVSACYRDRRALVLGAGGFIGRAVVAALAHGGAAITRVVRPGTAATSSTDRSANASIVECDLARFDDVADLVRSVQPAVVFNLAGYGVDPRERDEAVAFRTNALLVGVLCEAMTRYDDRAWMGARVIHTGSALEYGTAGGDLSESTTCSPTTIYGHSKLAGTRILVGLSRAAGLRAVVARLFTVYGPGEPAGRLLPTLISAAGGQGVIALTEGTQRRDFTYLGDVVEGLLRLGVADLEPGAVINLATGRLTSVRQFVEISADVLGIDRERLRFGDLPTRSEEMRHEPVDVTALSRATGWVPSLSIARGVTRTASRAGFQPGHRATAETAIGNG